MQKYLNEAVEVSNSKPILLDSYLTDAIEVDVDVVSDGGNIEIGGILWCNGVFQTGLPRMLTP